MAGTKQTREIAKRLLRDEEGQNVVEHALLMTLVTMAAIASFKTLANALKKDVFTNAAANRTPSRAGSPTDWRAMRRLTGSCSEGTGLSSGVGGVGLLNGCWRQCEAA